MPNRIEGTAEEIEALLAVIRLQSRLEDSVFSAPDAGEVGPRRRRLKEAMAALAPHVSAHLDAVLGRVHAAPIVVARPTHCPACHLRFAAVLESRLRTRSDFFFCPHCGRALYRLEPSPRREERQVSTRSRKTSRGAGA
jgi:predicted  nucleic acid-binding Zn-ribbon protein